MVDSNTLRIIKEVINDFFEKMTIAVDSEILLKEDQTISIQLKTEEPQILIGERGQTLADIQHLLKAILKRKIADPFFIDLDINNYRKKKVEYLKDLARSTADEVVFEKQEKALPSMPAYERRVIHMELAERSDITTESEGEEPDRRIVIKPVI
jgi:spoIIIJ-associated protein